MGNSEKTEAPRKRHWDKLISYSGVQLCLYSHLELKNSLYLGAGFDHSFWTNSLCVERIKLHPKIFWWHVNFNFKVFNVNLQFKVKCNGWHMTHVFTFICSKQFYFKKPYKVSLYQLVCFFHFYITSPQNILNAWVVRDTHRPVLDSTLSVAWSWFENLELCLCFLLLACSLIKSTWIHVSAVQRTLHCSYTL